MNKIMTIMAAVITTVSVSAQKNINEVLSEIEQNNTTLKSLREAVSAQKLENRTGIYLSNPEVEFNYLWGSPSQIGDRKDFSVRQEFDFPTISGLKGEVANQKDRLLELQYKADRMNILLESKKYCLDMIYYNSLLRELDTRLEHARTIVAIWKERLDKGEGNLPEYNEALLDMTKVKGEMTRIETERNIVMSHLKRMNGGVELQLTAIDFPEIQMPSDFSQWYAIAETKNPVLAYVRQETELGRTEVSLSKSMGLPTFSAGYMSEKVVGERYQGISLGMSIPLWSNRNRIKQAKSAVRAAESRQADARQQFLSQLEILYTRTIGLKSTAEIYKSSLVNANNSILLKKALDAGQISLLDYTLAMGIYYNTVEQALQAELDYQKAFAELSAFEL